MKRIQIEISYNNYKKYYYISLERGNILKFKTKRKANYFLSKYKKFLNDNLNALILNYKNIYNCYLEYYLQFDKYYTNKIKELNDVILLKLEKITTNFGSGWNGLVFENYESCYFYIHSLILLIKNYSQKFKIQNLIHQTTSLLYSYYNTFNSFRNVQNDLKIDLNYRKNYPFEIIHLKKSVSNN